MKREIKEKKHLSAKNLLTAVRQVFAKVPDVSQPPKSTGTSSKTRVNGRTKISTADCLMSALAIFGLKYSSLLQFDNDRQKHRVQTNIRNLYQVKKVPCDTYLRERLDEVDPSTIKDVFKIIFNKFQRDKRLEPYVFINGKDHKKENKYLMALDGTGHFSSKNVCCSHCCKKHHQDGSTTYYHQALGAAIVHPDKKVVIPLCPEPILCQDGATKNDCECNAARRLLRTVRQDHPNLGLIVVQDALSANGPHIRELQSLNMNFIIAATPTGNASLYEWLRGITLDEVSLIMDKKDIKKVKNEDAKMSQNYAKKAKKAQKNAKVSIKLRFVNQIPLNDTHPDLLVNFFECVETDLETGKETRFAWITDIKLTTTNIYDMMRGARSRWHIENETFNTLKNQGYEFEHNFGHGYKYLSTLFMMLMFLAFLIDQVQQAACYLFQSALSNSKMKIVLWTRMKGYLLDYIIESWSDLWLAIAKDHQDIILIPNTS